MKIRTIFAESWIGYIGELFKQYETVDIYRINIKSSDFFSDNNMTAIVGTINRRGVALQLIVQQHILFHQGIKLPIMPIKYLNYLSIIL